MIMETVEVDGHHGRHGHYDPMTVETVEPRLAHKGMKLYIRDSGYLLTFLPS
jgi:hypothetical protein